jgi:sugar phosphate isomerase/epimerase
MAPSFVPYAVNHPEAPRRRRARDWFLNTLDYAAACGAKHVTTLPGVTFKEEKLAESWARCCDELTWRVDQARRRGLVFGIEAHVGSIVPNPAGALRGAERAGIDARLSSTRISSASDRPT